MESFTLNEFIIYIITSLIVSLFAGIAGGGGGFIMTPLLIFLGLTPAQAVATGKLSGFSISVTSLVGLRKVKIRSKRELIVIMLIALIIGLLAPLIIKNLNSELYKNLLGVLLLLMIPVMILKKVGLHASRPSLMKKLAGYILLTVSMALQAVFSGGLGTLVNMVMMVFLGMPALIASVAKRYSQLLLNGSVTAGLLFSGLIYWPIAITGIITAGLGGYIGARLALKKGDSFVVTILIILMFISALGLILGGP